MYLRAAGCLLIAAAAAGYGMARGRDYQRQLEELACLQRLIWQLQGEIAYTRAPLDQVFDRVAGRAREPYRSWLQGLAGRIRAGDSPGMGELWEQETRKCLAGLPLPAGEWDELLGLGGQLGYLDVRMQEKALEWYEKRMGRRLAELRPQLPQRQRLCGWLGALGGLFLAVLLL